MADMADRFVTLRAVCGPGGRGSESVQHRHGLDLDLDLDHEVRGEGRGDAQQRAGARDTSTPSFADARDTPSWYRGSLSRVQSTT
jgi:hypothetical protein